MRQAGRVLGFWVGVFGLVVGLQSACFPAQSDELRRIGAPVEDIQFRLALLISDAAGHLRDGSVIRVSEVSAEEASSERKEVSAKEASSATKEVSAGSEEVSTERERDHSARSPGEMLAWFLKGAAALTAMVLFYKGLKWWVLRRRQSE